MIKIGMIGCGAVAHNNYARTLIGRREYGVAYVSDVDASQAASAASLFGAEAVDAETLVDHAEAVIVSTPPSTHAALLRLSLRPGQVVICEKPFMTSHVDAVRLVAEARSAGSRVYVGQFRRAFPQVELARSLVAAGVIGDVTAFSAKEGGRFTWRAVSAYPFEDPNGGVIWDTGSHTVDMALFGAMLDVYPDFDLEVVRVDKDKAEPSHELRARFRLGLNGRTIDGDVHVSRKTALPNVVMIEGTAGRLVFTTDLDDRVRLITPGSAVVLRSEHSYSDLLECFDLQLRRILLQDRAEAFAAESVLGQIKLLEGLTR
jgi:predicted dehydrogenase